MRTRILSSFVSCVVAGAALAGPLSPPPGPVTETGRFGPRTEINQTNTPGDADSVFRITQPGSYYLAGNVMGEAMKHGILITSDGVTLDLMGFELQGVLDSLDAISSGGGSVTNTRVLNGAIRGWGGAGVNLALGSNHHVRDILAFDNGGAAIATGGSALIESCLATGNRGDGIVCGDGSIVRQCGARGNFGNGIVCDEGSVVDGCTALKNGVDGISAANGSMISRCAAFDNGDEGIDALDGSSVVSNIARSNTDHGIAIGIGSTAFANSASDNTGIGIVGLFGATIASNAAYRNSRSGIFAGNAATVTNNTASSNDESGIRVSGGCLVTDNACANNGSDSMLHAGIWIEFGDNRIDGNHTSNNILGFRLDGLDNLVVRNSATESPSFSFTTPNIIGPFIVDDTAVDASSNPHANYAY